MTAGRIAGRVIVALAAAVLIVAAGVAWYAFSGRYSIAATEPHPPALEAAIDEIYHASVARQAAGIEAPALDRERAAAGAPIYAAECAMCHGVPEADREAWAEGLYPLPPHLPKDGTDLAAEEIFWIIREGVKFTSMPSYRHALSDEEIWSVTALVERLHGMTAEAYEELIALPAEEPGAGDAGDAEADAGGPGNG